MFFGCHQAITSFLEFPCLVFVCNSTVFPALNLSFFFESSLLFIFFDSFSFYYIFLLLRISVPLIFVRSTLPGVLLLVTSSFLNFSNFFLAFPFPSFSRVMFLGCHHAITSFLGMSLVFYLYFNMISSSRYVFLLNVRDQPI